MDPLVQQAQAALERGDLAQAARAFGRLVSASPRDHGAWYWLAIVHLRSGRPELALPAIEQALVLDRRNPDYQNARGVALAEAGRDEDAVQCLRKVIKLSPALTDAHYNLGKVLRKQRHLEEAIEALARARKIDATRGDVLDTFGRALIEAGQLARAHREHVEFARERPDDPDADRCLARTTAWIEGAAAADAVYARALRRFHEDGDLRWEHARFLLSTGRFAEGWKESLWRPTRRPGQPTLDKDGIAGKSVLLGQEQGIGDVLFFCRFVPLLRPSVARVALRCEAKLAPIVSRLNLFDEILVTAPIHADLACPLDDLPAIVGATAAVPSARLEARQTAEWKARLAALGPPPHVAVTWRAGTDNAKTPEFARPTDLLSKEVPAAALAHALRDVPGTLLAVQRQPRSGEVAEFSAAAARPVHDLCALNEDLEAMSELLFAVDDYVGVSNTNMHLTAAVGRTARVLIPFPPDWRWMLEGDESPWFPGFRVYRQTPEGSWAPAMERLRQDLIGVRRG